MRIPRGYTEKQVIDIINKVVSSLATNFTFGIFDRNDLIQEGWVEALNVLEKDVYDPKRPLENFLYSHLRNRYINLKRDKYKRTEIPCLQCPFYDKYNKVSKVGNQCAIFDDKMLCEKWESWTNRNNSKKGLMCPKDIDNLAVNEYESIVENYQLEEAVDNKDLFEYIDKHLPIEMRSDYLRMRDKDNKLKVPKYRLTKLKECLASIIEDYRCQE